MQSSKLAIDHWNKTPLFLSEEERYGTYPWLSAAAEFADHGSEDVLEIGWGTGCDLLQFVRHGHVTVNGKKVTIPSYSVQKGDSVAIKEKSRVNEQIKASVETARARGVPGWLDLSPESFSGRVTELPKREDIKLPISEQLIVELYSK